MPILNRNQILNAAGDTELVPVPEWASGEFDPDDPPSVRVRGLDAAYISGLIKKGLIKEDGSADISNMDFTEIAARSIMGNDGERMFTNRKQIEKLGEKAFGVISRIATVSLELAGLSSDDEDDSDTEKKAD